MINSCTVNHLFYTDERVLIAPSPKALQKFIDICVHYSNSFELTFIVKKTKIMWPKAMSHFHVPDFTLEGKKTRSCVCPKVSGSCDTWLCEG